MSEIILRLDHERYISFPKEGSVYSESIKEDCPYCADPDCYANCDGSAGDVDGLESEEQMYDRKVINTAIDTVESLLLALSEAGVINLVKDNEKIVEAVQITLDALVNHVEGE